ncbi:DUF1853 family protein [Marinobacter salinisoli]|uniref:DUF1853 family protein n=1 Tax=Marinobacter salinisoli TaxID=2769486 RepID=A0ABX7MMR8_9GAMM|nr:DUF1853 family protein [Marinobacter salinisoli]QSP93428.1 DUF1853 family protein [Marinobacter salinisoli]
MDTRDQPLNLFDFHHPAVRHLAWLCTAPQLIAGPSVFRPAEHLPPGYDKMLRRWDQSLSSMPELLRMESPPKRLGYYFERLYEVLLTDLLGWKVLLKNLQIQSEGRTLGELDFVVHNIVDDRIEHHEIAIKYYLGVPNGDSDTKWFGPNAKDRLDLKRDLLLNHQSKRTDAPEAIATLATHGIAGPLPCRIFMPGYLFYPLGLSLAPPGDAPTDHLRGWWVYANDAQTMDTSNWIELRKPHWVGPWRQKQAPCPAETTKRLDSINELRVPRLFAQLERAETTGEWREIRRIFVVPQTWLSQDCPELAVG